jgi:transposase-like protein
VPEIPRRRRFTKEQKLKIIRELEQCKIHGGKGLILRREGIYSTQVSQWKAQLGSSKKKKKKTPNNDYKNENERLKRQVARLEAKLEKSEKLIEIQKKMAKIIEDLNSGENASE